MHSDFFFRHTHTILMILHDRSIKMGCACLKNYIIMYRVPICLYCLYGYTSFIFLIHTFVFLFQIDSSTDRLNVYASFIIPPSPGHHPIRTITCRPCMRVCVCACGLVYSTYWDECFISDSDVRYSIIGVTKVLSLAATLFYYNIS